MSSEFIEELDLEGMDAEGVEKVWPLPGMYVVQVDDVHRSQDNKALVLRFMVEAGEFKGKKIEERLWDPTTGKSAESAAKMKERKAAFAKRLGLVPDEAWGTKAAINWFHAIGRFAVIKVVKRKYTDKDGNEKESVNVDYLGVWPLNHKDVPEAMRELARSVGLDTTGGPQQAQQQATTEQGTQQGHGQQTRQTVGAGTSGGASNNRQQFDDL